MNREVLGPFVVEHTDERRVRIFQGDEKLIEMAFDESVSPQDYVTKAFAQVAVVRGEAVEVTKDVVIDATGNIRINAPLATLAGNTVPAVVKED